MTLADLIGGVAACLTTLSFFPQAWRVIRTGDTQAISLVMYLMFTLGVACWGIYGLMTWQWSIIIANGITVTTAAIILSLKIRDVLKARRHLPS